VRTLGSKLFAGGLSAGVILLWWPHFFHGDSVSSWAVRGVVWTLCFELLVLALAPFEASLWETAPAKGMRTRVYSARDRLAPASPRRRLGLRAAVAAVAVLIPVALLAAGLNGGPPPGAERPKIEKVTKVTRIVKVERRDAAPAPAADHAPALVQNAPAPAPKRVVPEPSSKEKSPAKRPAAKRAEPEQTLAQPAPQSDPSQPAPSTQPAPQTQRQASGPQQQADAGGPS
jgi:hypothetical protein